MKTYKKTVNCPKLVIDYDNNATSPREWNNLGYFITVKNNVYSPDKPFDGMLENCITTIGNKVESLEKHIEIIKNWFELNTKEKILAIYPVIKYEHSGVVYKLGTAHGFNYSNNGFYIITDKTQKELGMPKKSFEKIIKQEINTYNRWMNGEVYSYKLYNDAGEVKDSCGGFYDIEDIRKYLPKEWAKENLAEYVINN